MRVAMGRQGAPRTAPADPPRVSVVIPCYNYGRFLPSAVGSALAQDGVDVDVLIVDDASRDGSDAIAEQLAAEDDQVRVIRHAHNRGHIATYNAGLAAVTGDFTVLLSADDMLTPGALARATALFALHPEVGLVYGHPRAFEGNAPAPSTRVRSWSVWSGSDWIRTRCRRGTNSIYSPEVVLRTSLQREIGGYRADLPHSADLEMWLRAAAVASIGRVNGPDQALRRIHGAAMSQSLYGSRLADLSGRRDAFHSFFTGAGRELRDAASLAALARRRLAREALDCAWHEADDGPCREAYAAFAVDLDPGVRRTRAWHRLNRRPVRRWPGSALSPHAVACDLSGRWRWRRWRWSGV